MSEEHKQDKSSQAVEPEVADKPELESGEEASAEESPPVERPRRGRGLLLANLVILLLTLGAAVVALGLGYQVYRQQQASAGQMADLRAQQENARQQQQRRIEKQLQDTRTALNSAGKELKQGLEQHAQRLAELEAAPVEPLDWSMEELLFLLRMANQQVELLHRRESALNTLQAASALLQRLDRPELRELEAQLKTEIAQLSAVKNINQGAISSELQAMIPAIEGLSLPALPQNWPGQRPPSHATQQEVEQKTGVWADLSRRLAEDFDRIFAMRKVDHPRLAVPSQAQGELIRHSLLQQVELARMSLLLGDQAFYSRILRESARSVRLVFDGESEDTNKVAGQLETLAAREVVTPLPNISVSLQMLEDLMIGKIGTPKSQVQEPPASAEPAVAPAPAEPAEEQPAPTPLPPSAPAGSEAPAGVAL